MKPHASDLIDHRLLHVEARSRAGTHPEHEAHTFFQASTLDALFAGKLEGDLTFAELAQHGDLGIGTLNGLDGEMVAVDGRFMRADADGVVTDVPLEARTPFAVVAFFEPAESFGVEGSLGYDAFLERLHRHASAPSCAVRIDGEFELVRARSVPRQRPPYRSLADAAHDQHVFQLLNVAGTMVGFRFPDYARGLEMPGYHLHFVDAERRRGGHVLACRPRRVEVQIDPSSELHLELPSGVHLGEPAADADEISRVERDG
jgi:acetolactate decarboxylase